MEKIWVVKGEKRSWAVFFVVRQAKKGKEKEACSGITRKLPWCLFLLFPLVVHFVFK